MIRLIVKDQLTNKEHELDTFGNENINITLQVDDVRNIENKNASYSKEFNLPATKNNNRFFEHFYNVDRYTTDFNVYKNLQAFLYVNDVLVLEGFIRLLNAADSNTEITYNVVLFNDVANIIETLADANINNLDLNDINHDFTTANIVLSWQENAVPLTAGGTTNNVYYSLTNDGQIYLDDNNLYVNFANNYMLNIKLKYIIDKIFNLAGFVYESNFFESSDFKKIYFDVGRRVLSSDFALNTINANTGSGTDSVGGEAGTNISNDIFNPTVINFVNETGDDDGNFNQSTSVFTAPFDCTVNINYRVHIVNSSLEQYGNIVCFAQGTQIGTVSVPDASLNSGNPYDLLHTFTGSVDLIAGEVMTLQFVAFAGDLMIYNTFNYPPKLSLDIIDTSTAAQIKANRGEIKLADILKDVITAFNLTIESKSNNTLKIEPYNNFVNNTVLNWTQKIDTNEFVIEPIEVPKKIELKHANDDKDFYLNEYKANHLQDYGTQIIEFDVETTDIVTIDLKVFAAPFVQEIENTNTNIQHIATFNNELKGFDHKPRLIFKNQTNIDVVYNTVELGQDGSIALNINNSINSGIPYDDNTTNAIDPIQQLTSNSDSLLFGFVSTVYIPTISAIPQNTLYLKYWSNYLNEKFNTSNGLIYKTEIYLTPTDLSSFSFANKIRVKDQLFRVNKIEYNTDINVLAKVELLRI